jgi:hypothetical protein
MPRQKMLAALFALVMPVLAASCSGDPDPSTESDFPLCAEGAMHVLGTIDGMPIDVTVPNGGSILSQGNEGGDFQFQTDITADPEEAVLVLHWEHGVLSDKTAPATGTLRLKEGPFASQSLCAAAGTAIRIPTDESLGVIQFQLAGIRSGDGCTVAHPGELRGCAN